MKIPVHMRLDEELLAAVDARAAELKWSRTAVVERALEAALGATGIASEPRPGASAANGSQLATDAPAPVSPPTPAAAATTERRQSKRELDMARQIKMNKAKGLT